MEYFAVDLAGTKKTRGRAGNGWGIVFSEAVAVATGFLKNACFMQRDEYRRVAARRLPIV